MKKLIYERKKKIIREISKEYEEKKKLDTKIESKDKKTEQMNNKRRLQMTREDTLIYERNKKTG